MHEIQGLFGNRIRLKKILFLLLNGDEFVNGLEVRDGRVSVVKCLVKLLVQPAVVLLYFVFINGV